MREKLPKSNMVGYDRPHQPWVCGRLAEGDPCAFGPSEKGICPALAECKPVEIDGHWQCDRPATRGGPCEEGPADQGHCCRAKKCQPTRSLRAKRGVIVRAAMVFATGVVLMMLGGSARNEWLAPGPLCSQHSQVLQGQAWETRCTSCHAAAEHQVGSWFTAVVGAKLGPVQPTKCLACHDKTIDAERALWPHNVPADYLSSLADPVREAHHGHPPAELACSVCHQEHHGADHDLAAMADDRCQACHTQHYHRFDSDHPEFTRWPYQRRTRIAFNHSTHQGKHFVEKQHEFTCQQCHVEDASGVVQMTLGYDASCAECHNSDIATSSASGVTAVALPMLDTELLAEAGHDLADWPARATGDFDGKLPAVLKLLLADDPAAQQAFAVLGPDADFYDVDIDDPEQLTAAANLAMAIQRRIDLLQSPDSSESAEVQGLTAELVAAARLAWSGDDSPAEAPTPRSGTWWVDNVGLSIRYQPTGHADPLLKAWLEAIVSIRDQPLRESLLAEFTGPGALGRCTVCHSIDSSDLSTGLQIHWKSHDRRGDPRGFTRFSHAPHLLPRELRDCTACHALDPNASTEGSYSGYNPQAFTSEFAAINKATCAACHRSGAVSDRCTECHNYHVDWPSE
ncbi:hypothetical protein [Aeoliella mucimassa]|uniref:Uncharacterized protein n=1 Tax=Aeoliella mucimassa TaxID=2527972 RepID=A0A518AKH2_9BACT|nr:hypothetical protein [Aeoliella mucimassa]QDU55196.1 hypothetical protein Pan181_13820 [Aeoliella mucimassa]